MTLRTYAGAAVLAALMSVHAAHAQTHVHDSPSLGTVEFPISCSEASQKGFNRAVALLHHMTYPQAREAFEQVASAEPACAMAHWGIAMTLFQPLWPTRPSPAELQRGWALTQKAHSLAPDSARERAFIAAAAAFFREPAGTDYWQRIRRWEAASENAYLANPDDPETALFYALAHLATTPASSSSRAHADKAAEILVRVYKRQPDHPGAMHYLVHANDVPGRERELLEVTRQYDAVAPNNPHALHMPTHIYTRLGEWDGVVRGNLRAADAALLHPAGEKGDLVWDEFAHAIEYLVYAYLQQGADTQAQAQLKRLHETKRIQPSFKTAFHLASTQARYALERHAWAEAAAIEPRRPSTLEWDRFMWAEATAEFARGLGAAHLKQNDRVDATLKRLGELETAAKAIGEDLFARNIRVLDLELAAWRAHTNGDSGRSVELLREAVDLEASTPKHAVTPGPTLPASELLGDLLLEQRNPAAALAAYKQSLAAYPKRLNSLVGAARAAALVGDRSAAKAFRDEVAVVAKQGTREISFDGVAD